MQNIHLSPATTDNLPYLNLNDNLDLSSLKTLIEREEEKMRRDTILRNHPSPITQLPNGDWYTRINGKKVQSKSMQYVEDRIVSAAKSPVISINSIFEDYLRIRKETVEPTTWRKDIYIFTVLIKPSPIGEKSVDKLTINDGYNFFNYCKNVKPGMKKRHWDNVRCTFNSIFQYCIDQGYITSNPFINVRPKRNAFAPPRRTPDNEKIFSEEERKEIVSHAFKMADKPNNAIFLGIVLLFNLGIRNGELSALKWQDIETDTHNRPYIHIQGQIVEKVDDNSGKSDGWVYFPYTKSEAGNRRLPLNSTCQKAISLTKELNEAAGYECPQIPSRCPSNGLYNAVLKWYADPAYSKICRAYNAYNDNGIH